MLSLWLLQHYGGFLVTRKAARRQYMQLEELWKGVLETRRVRVPARLFSQLFDCGVLFLKMKVLNYLPHFRVHPALNLYESFIWSIVVKEKLELGIFQTGTFYMSLKILEISTYMIYNIIVSLEIK